MTSPGCAPADFENRAAADDASSTTVWGRSCRTCTALSQGYVLVCLCAKSGFSVAADVKHTRQVLAQSACATFIAIFAACIMFVAPFLSADVRGLEEFAALLQSMDASRMVPKLVYIEAVLHASSGTYILALCSLKSFIGHKPMEMQ